MKTLADLKRTMVVGVKAKMTRNDWCPNASIINQVRTVHSAGSGHISFLSEDGRESWLHFTSAKRFIFDGTNQFAVILNPDVQGEDKPLMVYEVLG